MICTGPCFFRYATIVGKIVGELWKSPVKDIIIDLIKEAKSPQRISSTAKYQYM